METRHSRISCLFVLLCILYSAQAQSDPPPFPHIADLEVEFYQTEVTVTNIDQQITTLATEYYDASVPRGKVDLLVKGNRQSVYFNNDTKQILEINETTCQSWDIDESIWDYQALFYGWLNKQPIVIGPSAPLWYAQGRREDIKSLGESNIRDIKCYMYSLDILGKRDNVTVYYHFAADTWTTPYQMTGFRVPIRIEVRGITSQDSEDPDQWMPVNQITDFAYFRPSISDWLKFQPAIGIGCPLRKSTRTIPKVPKQFMYAAEAFDVLKAKDTEVADVEFQQVWYDSERMIARLDKYTRMRFTSELYDFNTGVTYSNLDDQTCTIKPLTGSMFERYEGVKMLGYFKTPAEVLNLDGDFYYMGKRMIRGIWADSFESIKTDVVFMKKSLVKLVVTVFFSQDFYEVAVEGETETRIPIYQIITGWDTPTHIAINLQYNIFAFDDIVWPEMYETFQLGRCFPSMNDKSYFVMILNVQPELAAKLENADALVSLQFRAKIKEIGKVSDMRVPLLNIDYKASGVFVTGLMLERPPALAQFKKEYEGEVITPDPDVKVVVSADSQEQCAYSCVDETDFTCKGFYFCGQACFLKSEDIMERNDDDKAKKENLGVCETWIRAEAQSRNKEEYLVNALERIENAVLNDTFKVVIKFDKNTTVVIPVNDMIIGDGPYTGENNQDKPYDVVVNFAKLKATDTTTEEQPYIDNINDCYKACKNSESIACASFSYCGDSSNKQCRLSSVLVVNRKKNPDDTEDDRNCYVYSLKYLDLYDPYPGRTLLISGEDAFDKITAVEQCAKLCREETKFACRGFEYCRTAKTCVLHSKHILDLKEGQYFDSKKKTCTHYAAKFSADYYDMGYPLIDDQSDTRTELSLEECARACSEEMKATCRSFNYCPASGPYMTDSSCALSSKILTDPRITTTTKGKCHHYEKKATVDDWAKTITKPLATAGYTSKGFTGLVIGMLALGLVLGAMGFVLYSYFKSKSSGEGMTVKFMKSDI